MQAFAERAVWSRAALQDAFPDLKWATAKMYRGTHDAHTFTCCSTMLPYLAYVMTQGPWRLCFVRFGFDPRTAPAAAKLQASPHVLIAAD